MARRRGNLKHMIRPRSRLATAADASVAIFPMRCVVGAEATASLDVIGTTSYSRRMQMLCEVCRVLGKAALARCSMWRSVRCSCCCIPINARRTHELHGVSAENKSVIVTIIK